MAQGVRKQRGVRMLDAEWRELKRAAAFESDRRGESVDASTLVRELAVRGARRINARAATLTQRPEMAAVA